MVPANMAPSDIRLGDSLRLGLPASGAMVVRFEHPLKAPAIVDQAIEPQLRMEMTTLALAGSEPK